MNNIKDDFIDWLINNHTLIKEKLAYLKKDYEEQKKLLFFPKELEFLKNETIELIITEIANLFQFYTSHDFSQTLEILKELPDYKLFYIIGIE